MASKPFYSMQETQQKLGVSDDQIRKLVSEGRLREFRSQGQLHFKSEEVDRLAGDLGLGVADDVFSGLGGIANERPPAKKDSLDQPSFGSNMGSADIGLSESVGFANQDDLGLSESVGFSMPADDEQARSQGHQVAVVNAPSGAGSAEVNLAGISGSQTGLGSADLGLSESVGFSAGMSESDSDSKSDGVDTAKKAKASPAPPPVQGDLGLSESVGFSQLEDSDADVARQAPRGFGGDLSSSDTPNMGTSNEPDEITLETADTPAPSRGKKKGDTVITTAGINVFDDAELEVEADPKARTAVAPTVDEQQLSLEGVGSGSGLLDLTREADDTKLDDDLIGDLYPPAGSQPSITMDPTVGGGMPGGSNLAISAYGAPQVQIQERYIDEFEVRDPFEVLFGIILIAPALVMLCAGLTVASALTGATPDFTKALLENGIVIGIVGAVVTIITVVVGYVLGNQAKAAMALEAKRAELKAMAG